MIELLICLKVALCLVSLANGLVKLWRSLKIDGTV